MKKSIKKSIAIALAATSAIAVGTFMTACGTTDDGLINGTEYIYRVLPSPDTYEFTGNPTTSVVPDDNIAVDGVFDEAFYASKKWFKGNKVLSSGETGTLEVTTHFTKKGILVAAKVRDSRPAVHSSWVETGNLSCFNCYFAFGDAKEQADGLYEIECTAGNRFKISQFTPSGIKNMRPEFDVMPVTAVKREGDIKAGTCYNYDVEYFMPYALFGRDTRPDKVFLSPTLISSTLDDTGNYIEAARTWYNFSTRQLSSNITGWAKVNQGIVFDYDGFLANKITITASGGSVKQIYDNDWCVVGDLVKFDITPDSGKALTRITVNGKDYMSSVENNSISVLCDGDITIDATFA